ncbi:huntingtin-interacting protein K [Aspergillus undulatus]|uniref:huntingtin-interacting protein K n=1 Tax=Aspergillus undulatus TaxID=1810928 RepID=UPI003CCE5077
MSDPIPSAAPSDPSTTTSTSAEDRKAAAALSSLNTTEISASGAEPGSGGTSGAKQQPSSADQEALGKAMSRLEIAAGKGKASGKAASSKEGTTGGNGKGAEGGKKVAAVKVSGEDVALLVSELDLSKIKATELLKANEGDAKRAIRAFISAPVGA